MVHLLLSRPLQRTAARCPNISRDECARLGRDPSEVELTAGGPVHSLDDVKRFQDLGVSRVILSPPGFQPDKLEQGLEKLGNELISKL